MAKVLTTLTTMLVLLWPILGAAEGSDFLYKSVTSPAEDRAIEKPLAHTPPSQCLGPDGISSNRTIAYEVKDFSWCGAAFPVTADFQLFKVWFIGFTYGEKVKVRYAVRDTGNQTYTCLPSDPMFLWLRAPAMGINDRFLNSVGQWVSSFTNFRNDSPPTNVWNDLYFDYPPKGDYVLAMGCDSFQNKWGQIQFGVK